MVRSAAAASAPVSRFLPVLDPQLVTPLAAIPVEGGVVYAKQEYMNPSGSTKDRIARFILTKALREGTLEPGGRVVEASSGSTSMAMAMACARLGLRFTAVMPAGVSGERVLSIEAYGGKTHLASPGAGIGECLRIAGEIAASEGAFLPRQFENPDNAAAHRLGTAREAMEQLPGGRCDAVVSGVGTGGTLVGLWQGVRDHGAAALPVLARPVAASGVFAAGCFQEAECSREAGPFSSRIPGVVDCVSRLFSPGAMPGLVTFEIMDEDALAETRRLIALGQPVGPSSGLNLLAAARSLAHLRAAGLADPVVLTVLPDRMERYFSTELFARD